MKLGFFIMPVHPPARNYAETLKEDREAFILADRLGYSEGYCGEHLTDQAENIPNSMMFIATLMGATSQIKLGTAVVNLPHSHPVVVASNAAMLDNLLEGRFILGVGAGVLRSDAEALGMLDADRNAMFAEAIDQIVALWAGTAPIDIKGKYWTISTQKTIWPEVGIGDIVKPYQKPHPPIVVTAVAPHSKGVTEAAKRGWTPISANFLLPEWVASHWPKYQEGCVANNKKPDGKDWRVAKSIFVADSEATAKEYGHGPKGPYYFYFKQLLRKLVGGGRANLFKLDQNEPDASITADSVTPKLVIAGTPNSVVEQILAFREKVGPFGTLYYPCHDWVDPRLARRSMQLMAEQVMPRINDALKDRA
jgi:alkanesulfonate monooxygenase SsuD/methylene tetrahydromethanopterin reductase-like flavin-dependent oxidoreductase (luciferase family)